MKLQTLVNSEQALVKLSEAKLPIKTAYWLSRDIDKIASELKIYHEKRNALIKELGQPSKENPDNIQVTPENIPKFVEELTKLGEIDVDLELKKFKIEELGEITIEPKYLSALDFIINE